MGDLPLVHGEDIGEASKVVIDKVLGEFGYRHLSLLYLGVEGGFRGEAGNPYCKTSLLTRVMRI